MEDLRFNVLFNSISVISRQWAGDNERLCAMNPVSDLKDLTGLESRAARSVGQLSPIELPGLLLSKGDAVQSLTCILHKWS